MEFEKAALLRDQIKELKRMMGGGKESAPGSAQLVSYKKSNQAKRRR